MKKPLSDKQLAANRANVAKSTGPTTAEGKSRSCQNARKHGFAAAQYSVVRLEEFDTLANLREDAITTYQPANSQELFAVERIALAQLNLLRMAALEAGLFTEAMNQTITAAGNPWRLLSDDLCRDVKVAESQNRSLCLATGFQRLIGRNDGWRLFLRYQAQTERLYRRAVEEFERLRAIRDELPNEPSSPDAAPLLPEKILPQPKPVSAEDAEERYAAIFDHDRCLPAPFPVHIPPNEPTVPYFPPKDGKKLNLPL